MNPTVDQSIAISDVFDYLNKELFGENLNLPMIVFNRSNRIIGGYYSPKKWFTSEGVAVDEIAINANVMVESDEVGIFGILIHEMVHLWQYHNGTPGRGGYHNQEWVDKCLEIGLKPINISDPAIMTGDTIDTKLIDDGMASRVIACMPEELSIPFYAEIINLPESKGGSGEGSGEGSEGSGDGSGERSEGNGSVPRSGKRTKYTCPVCGTNLWGKGGLKLLCIGCEMKFIEMV